jgi:DNA-binding LacI/PurR family transcriptional regulator/anti-anti-sigma regulatory factor
MSVARKAIGVLSPQLSGDYFGRLLAGIYSVTQRHDPRLIGVQGRPQGMFASRIAWDQVDGWIVLNDTSGLEQVAPPGMPLVTIGALAPGLDCPAVFPDNRGGMRTAVLHLIGHGHQRIGFVGNMAHNDVQQRYEGYQAALAEHGIPLDPALVVSVADNLESSGANAFQCLQAAGVSCTALCGGTDLHALGVMAAAQAAGYRVPEDLAVVGFDDILLAHTSTPPLTTVKLPIRELGSTAAELLLAQIAGQTVPSGATYVATALIPRRSCNCSVSELAVLQTEEHSTGWQQSLAQQLTQLACYPSAPEATTQLGQVWPGGAILIQALADVAQGQEPPPSATLYRAWQEMVTINENLETLVEILKVMGNAGARLMATLPDAARSQVAMLTERLRLEMMRARLALETNYIRSYSSLVQQSYAISITLLAEDSTNAQQLAWLRRTPLNWGCLGLWEDSNSNNPALTIVGSYYRNDASGSAGHPLGKRYAAPLFPPPELLPGSVYEADADIIILLPIKAPNNRGVLALACPIPYLRTSGNYDLLTAFATLLSAALERESLVGTLRAAYERERSLADIVRELGSPIIPLLPDVLLVPLVGAIDSGRAQQIIEAVLEGITTNQATSVLLDITGVPLVDTQVANSLVQTARAASLLGARVILVGVRPEIAQSIIGLGVDLRHLATQPTLAAALRVLLAERRRL